MSIASSPLQSQRQPDGRSDFRVAVIGSGFAGLGMAVQLKRAGIEDFVVLQRAADLGGTWRDNTYPGCQCDVPSTLYSFSFAPNDRWTHTYPLQQAIWDYLRDIARDNGIEPHIRYRQEVSAGNWDARERRWVIETTAGTVRARLVVFGVGGCSSWYLDAHGRNTTLWPSFTFRFRERTRKFDPGDYVLGSMLESVAAAA